LYPLRVPPFDIGIERCYLRRTIVDAIIEQHPLLLFFIFSISWNIHIVDNMPPLINVHRKKLAFVNFDFQFDIAGAVFDFPPSFVSETQIG